MQSGLIISIILFWALPAILPQLLFGADILWHYRKLVFWSFVIPATYLSLMDIVALKGNDMVNFPKSNNRDFILWDSAARRSRLLFHHKHDDHIRHDATAGKRQSGEIYRDQETTSGVERKRRSIRSHIDKIINPIAGDENV